MFCILMGAIAYWNFQINHLFCSVHFVNFNKSYLQVYLIISLAMVNRSISFNHLIAAYRWNGILVLFIHATDHKLYYPTFQKGASKYTDKMILSRFPLSGHNFRHSVSEPIPSPNLKPKTESYFSSISAENTLVFIYLLPLQ